MRLVSLVSCMICLFGGFHAMAQEQCGTVPYTKKLKAEKKIPQNDLQFENWLRGKMARHAQRNQRTQSTPYKIPVVVHVIHNGEAVGSGTNISDAQILSQIKVLNEDFRRLNADAVNTPPEFAAIAGSLDIEFVLAKQNPEGLSTSGIVRVQGEKTGWTVDDNYQLKSQSYWPAEDYLNIWVCNLTGDLIGYAQLPESDELDGLENSSNNRLTDGVVIWYRAFGSADDGNFNLSPEFNKGRTTTHEVGHFFGLRHIWGDDDSACTGTDYVDDTPNQSGSTSGCPAHPQSDNCTSKKMFQNFLDYTDDECMNLFTQGQAERMTTVIENSPRRASLLNSHGLNDPIPVADDLGIKEIISPLKKNCSTDVAPIIRVKNYGSTPITSGKIQLTVNGTPVETKDFSVSLDNYLDSASITFNDVNAGTGSNVFDFRILQTNGGPDGNTENNNLSQTVFIPESAPTPLYENLNTLPSTWSVENPDQQIGWEITTTPHDTPGNKELYLDFYDYEDGLGEEDAFVSPVLDLSAAPVASLFFDISHARYQSSNDRLKVIVLKDCEDINSGTVVYDKSGQDLATAPATSQAFAPDSEDEWRKELVNISSFAGQNHVQIAFLGINDWGNNLYIDDISIVTTKLEDLSLNSMLSPAVVTCEEQPQPSILVRNIGTVTVTRFDVRYAVNNGTAQTLPMENLLLNPGDQMEITLPPISLREGINKLTIDIVSPNGNVDETSSDNHGEFTIAVNTDSDKIPLRENFDQSFPEWTLLNPTGGMNWQSISTNFNTSVYFNAYNNAATGDEAWLVSPVLDFSNTIEASLVFDISHAMRNTKKEDLRLMVSKDCGDTYLPIDLSFASEEEATEWIPSVESDWQKNVVVNLSAYAGEKQVRVAFVVTNANGNNLFIDNIEFFTSANPDTIEIDNRYAIYGYDLAAPANQALKITFNLPERQDVRYSIVDMMGAFHADGVLKDVLNQTYPLEAETSLAPGLYVVRLKIGNRFYADKILIPQ